MKFNFKNFFNTIETEANKRDVLFNMTDDTIIDQLNFESIDDLTFTEIKSSGMPFSKILNITFMSRINDVFFTCEARIRTNVKMNMDEFSTTFDMNGVSIQNFDKIQKISESFKIAVKAITEDMIEEIVDTEEYIFEDEFMKIFEEKRNQLSA